MSRYTYVSIDRIFSKLIRDLGDGSIVEGDVIEWVGEALEFIQAVKSYEEAVAYIEVKNHQCKLPAGIHAVIQIARNKCFTEADADALCPASIIADSSESTETTPSIPVALDCNGTPINDYDLAYYRPYFDMKNDYTHWSNSSYYKSCYSPVRLATSTFFNTLVCKEQGYDSIYQGCTDEYTIIAGDILRFSFQTGSVAVAYVRQMVDPATGYPMIPDNISYTTAIVKYITMRIFERQFYAGREGAKSKVDKAEADWQWYCKQASNVDMMPFGIDEHQNLLDQRSYLLPNHNRYYGFFGRMANPESRRYNDPDNRNNRASYFVGN